LGFEPKTFWILMKNIMLLSMPTLPL